MVVRYRFGRDDLLRTRFAIAPLMDLIGAFYVLRDPGRSVVHRPWREWAVPRTAGLDLSLLDVAAPMGRRGFWPVFVGPPPKVPHAEIDSELDRIRATPPQHVKDEIMRTYPRGPTAARPFAEDPVGTLAELVGQMRAFWEAALAPWWARMSAVLESDPGDLHLAPNLATHRPAMGSRTGLPGRWHRRCLGRRWAGRR